MPKLNRSPNRGLSKPIWLEMISIIVAVVLALGLDSWWSEIQTQRRADEILVLIEDELTTNLENLRDSLGHHESQLEFYFEYTNSHDVLTEEDYEVVSKYFFSQGVFRPALITQTGWDIAKYTGITGRLDIATLRTLNELYTKHELYKDNWKQGLTAHSLTSVFSDERGRQVIATTDAFNQTIWLERMLVTETEHSLTYLRNRRVGSDQGAELASSPGGE